MSRSYFIMKIFWSRNENKQEVFIKKMLHKEIKTDSRDPPKTFAHNEQKLEKRKMEHI